MIQTGDSYDAQPGSYFSGPDAAHPTHRRITLDGDCQRLGKERRIIELDHTDVMAILINWFSKHYGVTLSASQIQLFLKEGNQLPRIDKVVVEITR